MQKELRAVLAGEAEFAPYVKGNSDRPLPNNVLLNDPSWGAYYLWENGRKIEQHAQKCPATMAALALTPMPEIEARSPVALFSLLKPDTHIRPHYGLLNTRLICHIPLITNDMCSLRVGAETRQWEDGKALIFDDSFEHEAWNKGDQTRIILLFEIWRPELSADEKLALAQIYETVNYYDQGQAP